MRVALVALTCPRGGMVHYTTQLANALARQAEVHLFAPAGASLAPYLDPAVRRGTTVPFSRPNETVRNTLRQLNPFAHLANAARVRACQPDVVHLVTDHPSNGLLLSLLGDLPTVFTHHDPTRHPGEAHHLKQALTDDVARRADRVIVHAEALRAELVPLGLGPDRVAVIPHGDYAFMRDLAPDVPETPSILCFGRFVRYKGIDDLCRAERLLQSRLGDYEVVIAGDGDDAFFRDEIAPGARIRVIRRFTSDLETATLFARARVVVLPYIQASQSGVTAIAFAFGKPVIVTDVGGLPEAVGHGDAGLVVPARRPVALAEAIARLWHDPALRTRLGDAGRAHIERTIGWPHIAARHLALYRSLVPCAAAA